MQPEELGGPGAVAAGALGAHFSVPSTTPEAYTSPGISDLVIWMKLTDRYRYEALDSHRLAAYSSPAPPQPACHHRYPCWRSAPGCCDTSLTATAKRPGNERHSQSFRSKKHCAPSHHQLRNERDE